MRHDRALVTRLLALLLLLQWGTAIAYSMRPLAAAGSAHSVEICGAGGLTTVVLLDDEDRPDEKLQPSHATCPACCGPTALGAPAPVVAPEPVVWPGEAPVPSREGLPVAPARAPPQQPRAPPTA